MSKRKLDAKAFAQQKRKRRQWLAFVRMCRYGINNFSRNAWLSIAATAVMTITLLVVFTAVSARNVLVDTIDQIRDKVDMSIYLRNDTTDEQAETVKVELEKLQSVKRVAYINPVDAKKDFARTNKTSGDTLEALNVATNKFPGILRVNIIDINDPSELDTFVKTNENLKKYIDPAREPSFSGDRRSAIQNIARGVDFAEKAGLGASILFIVISSLIVFNTIRMAIFNRKEEIQMMKLIGADRSFIRGPFIVEAIMYGFIAAIIATAIGFAILYGVKENLNVFQVAIQPTIDFVTLYAGFVLLGLIILGAIIGVISSLLATHRYLRI